MRFNARAWVSWLVAVAAAALVTRNPLYTIVLLLILAVVAEVCAVPEARVELPLVRIGAFFVVFAALFNVLSVHVGRTVLFQFPSSWPWIGGPITLEAAVFGAISGLVLFALLVVFTVFNAVVPANELIRLTPAALRELGVVVLIAVTYVPETRRQLQRIREAQAIRGHRLRGVRDWRPIVIPLLIGGLERAMGVAEAMVARGYGATVDVAQPLAMRAGLAAGLAAAFAGWFLAFWLGWPGWLVMAAGVALIAMLIWHANRGLLQTRYRPQAWTTADTGLVVTAVLCLSLLFLPLPFVDRATLFYSPYPSLTLPRFDPFLGMALVLLAFPALATAAGNYEAGMGEQGQEAISHDHHRPT